MKYIIVENKLPILFPDDISHKQMARGLNVTSAGFSVYDPCDNVMICFGESCSIGVKSQPKDDENIINNFLRLRDL